MTRQAGALALAGLWAAIVIAGCDGSAAGGPTPAASAPDRLTVDELAIATTLSPLEAPPVDETNAVVGDPQAARLGHFLFFDTRLSANGEVSCASCHDPKHAFGGPERLGQGIGQTPRHPPTILNAAHQPFFNWDGRADSLWAQAQGPLEAAHEQGTSRTDVARLVTGDPELRRAYEAVFGPAPDLSDEGRFPPGAKPVVDEPDAEAHQAWQAMADADRRTVDRVFTNTLKAIAAYETRLASGPAPFDRWVAHVEAGGDQAAGPLDASARRGLKLFVGEAGCVNCHSSAALSDGAFHNLGLGSREWLGEGLDEGRWDGVPRLKASPFNAAGAFSDATGGKKARWLKYLARTPEDHGQFKTPTLRNVAQSAPYMHGGHFERLEDVVRFYSTLGERVQVGHREEMLEPLGLTEVEIADLVAFLESLTGEVPAELMEPPASPVMEGDGQGDDGRSE